MTAMAKKQLRPQDVTMLQMLRDRSILTISFVEAAHDFPSGAAFRAAVEDAAAKQDLRVLRLLSSEIDKMTIALPSHEREGLEAILQGRLGVDKDAERAELQRQVSSILARGTIASEKERRRLEDYAEMLEATGGDKAEIDAVRRLVSK